VKFVGGVTTSFITEFSIAAAPTWEPTLPGEEKCAPISYLSCDQVRVTGNLTVDFNSDLSNTLQDKNGVGMGFRMVDVAPNAEVSSSYPLSAPGLDQSPSLSWRLIQLQGYSECWLLMVDSLVPILTISRML